MPFLKVFVSATWVLLTLKQFHASVSLGYLCCWFEMLEMVQGGVGGKCSSHSMHVKWQQCHQVVRLKMTCWNGLCILSVHVGYIRDTKTLRHITDKICIVVLFLKFLTSSFCLFLRPQTYARWLGKWRGNGHVYWPMGHWGWGHVEQPHLPGEQLFLQLLGQWTQEGPEQGQRTHLVILS